RLDGGQDLLRGVLAVEQAGDRLHRTAGENVQVTLGHQIDAFSVNDLHAVVPAEARPDVHANSFRQCTRRSESTWSSASLSRVSPAAASPLTAERVSRSARRRSANQRPVR